MDKVFLWNGNDPLVLFNGEKVFPDEIEERFGVKRSDDVIVHTSVDGRCKMISLMENVMSAYSISKEGLDDPDEKDNIVQKIREVIIENERNVLNAE